MNVATVILLSLLLAMVLPAQEAAPREQPEPVLSPQAAGIDSAAADASLAAERTALNLLGEVDAEPGEGRRNENVKLTLIDNNVLKELNTRMGTTATISPEFNIDEGYFGAQYGGAVKTSIHLPVDPSSGFHGNLFWSHGNSTFSARSFFQVGAVQPARTLSEELLPHRNLPK